MSANVERDPKPRSILDMNAFDPARQEAAPELLQRRRRNSGPLSVLFYRRPIEMIEARGAWMTAADGRRYLDMYNNVPSVGHGHPRVVEAAMRQMERLNTNTRYLHDTVERYRERLLQTFDGNLDKLILCCSGSEANDLALQMAARATGARGVVVTETAYHGNTTAVRAISPASLKRGDLPAHVRIVPAPDRRAYGHNITGGMALAIRAAADDLKRSGYGFSAFVADAVFSSDGVFTEPERFLLAVQREVHRAGGLYIADEVQCGFGRTGTRLWGYQRHLVKPDIVTLGKPMGNGYPMSGLVTRYDLMAGVAEDTGYFNTFGGNTVAAATGLAVLEVLEAEQLGLNAAEVGAGLKRQIEALAQADRRIRAVRGCGLYLGIELVDDNGAPAPELCIEAIEALRRHGILIGAAGRYGNVLKVRPPLCLQPEEAALLPEALASALESIPV